MIIAVASGKGGTGKTTVSVNLAKVFPGAVQLFDCDVEEPNAHLFLKGDMSGQEIVSIAVPEIDEALCNGCGQCGSFCRFHAIVSLKTTPLLFPELCHGCGGCTLVCPAAAIRERARQIGVIETVRAGHITLVQGRLDVGEPMAPPLIRALKSRISRHRMTILDAPPGTSCPVITTLRGADFAILVTEPTPFGLHDLQLAIDVIREIAVPFGVVVNRVGIGDDRVHAFCRAEGIPVLLDLPDDRRIAEAYSRGLPVIDAVSEYRSHFQLLMERVMAFMETPKGASSAGTGGRQ